MSDEALRSYVDRLLRLNEERKVITDDIKDVCAEAKGQGYNAKALRALVSELMKDDRSREAANEVQNDLDLYRERYHARTPHGYEAREAAE